MANDNVNRIDEILRGIWPEQVKSLHECFLLAARRSDDIPVAAGTCILCHIFRNDTLYAGAVAKKLGIASRLSTVGRMIERSANVGFLQLLEGPIPDVPNNAKCYEPTEPDDGQVPRIVEIARELGIPVACCIEFD